MKRVISIVCFLLITVAVQTSTARAQLYPVTIQGSLKDGDVPANGNYEILFAFFTAATGGESLGTRNYGNVPVTNGIFTVTGAFGQITNTPLIEQWIEFRVRPSGSSVPHTVLAPRQLMTYAPLAVTAINAENATRINGLSSSDLVQTNDSRLTDARPPTSGSQHYINNTATVQAGNFNISGTGIATTLDASQYKLGGSQILGNGEIPDNLFIGLSAGQTNQGGLGNTFTGTGAGRDNQSGNANSFYGKHAGVLTTNGSNNSFFGFESGAQNVGGAQNSFFGRLAGNANTIGVNNSAFGSRSLVASTGGFNNAMFGSEAGSTLTSGSSNTFIGTSTGLSATSSNFNTALGYAADIAPGLTNASAIGHRAKATQNNSLILGSINGVNLATADTNVGIGTTTPASRLHVNGTIRVTNGAVYITNPNTVVITSPNGACWGITVNNSGALATFPVNPCP